MLIALLACAPPSATGHLPEHVAVTVVFSDGRPGTLLAHLEAPDRPPTLRSSEDGWVFRDGLPVPVASREPLPGTWAEGPGAGFGVEKIGDEVWLVLPQDRVRLVRGVDELVEVALLTELDHQAADLVFKSVRALHAAQMPARIDGSLEEWSGQSLAIDTATHVQGDAGDWSSPRDASLALAARVHHDRISLAVRIRDEALILGGDRLEIAAPGMSPVVIPVGAAGACEVPEGWECRWVDAVDFGTGVELSLPDTRPNAGSQELDLVVRYVDLDPGESPTTLASAPSTQAVELFGRYQRPGPSGSGANSKISTTATP